MKKTMFFFTCPSLWQTITKQTYAYTAFVFLVFMLSASSMKAQWFYDNMGTATTGTFTTYTNAGAANTAAITNQGLVVTTNSTATTGVSDFTTGWDGVTAGANSGTGGSVAWLWSSTTYPGTTKPTFVTFTYTLQLTTGASATISSLSFGLRRTTEGLKNVSEIKINGINYKSSPFGTTTFSNGLTPAPTDLANTNWHAVVCTLSAPASFTSGQTITIQIKMDTEAANTGITSMRNRLDEFKIFGVLNPPVTCTTPTAYNVTGGGAYCSGGAGVAVGLANSQTGVNYQLKLNGSAVGATVAGNTGNAITFGNQTAAGNYTVDAATATGGCTNTMTGGVSVTVNPVVGTPSFVSPTTTLCAGGTATYTATASNSTGISYSILAGGATINPSTGQVSSVTGNFTVVATATGTCGGPTTANQAVTVNGSLGTPSFTGGATTLCAGGTSTYQATASNSTGMSYSILGNTGATIDANTGVVSGVTGNFTVVATATGCGGPTTANQAVTVTPLVGAASYSAGATTLCAGTTSTYTASAANATSVTYSIFAGGASINATTGVVSNVTSNFTVRATASNTCNSTTVDRSVTVFTPSATATFTTNGGTIANPTAIAGNPNRNMQLTGCEGVPITLTANVSNHTSFEWLKNGAAMPGSQNQATIPVTISWGDYQLVAYDINGCGTYTDTVGISLKKATANAGIDRNICIGSTTTLGTGGYPSGTTYTWTPSTNLSASNVSTPTVSSALTSNTTYSLVVTSPFVEQEASFTCTSAPDAVNVTLKTLPAAPTIARTSASDIACQGGAGIILTASNVIGTIQWYRGSAVGPTSNPITEFSTSGVPRVYTAKNFSNGCYSVASNPVTITILNAPVPTVTSSVGTLQSGSNTQFNLCAGVTNAIFTASSATSANTATPTYAWYNPVVSSTTSIGAGNTLAVAGITTANQRRFVRATYVYPSLTCTANSLTMDIRQNALATGCRLMQNGQEEEVSLENTFSAYPNPTSDKLTAQIQVLTAGEANLSLVNGLGQIVWQEQRSLEAGKTDVTLSLAQLPAGIYHLLLDKEDMHQSVKVVKE